MFNDSTMSDGHKKENMKENIGNSDSPKEREEWEIQRDLAKTEGDAAYRSRSFSSAISHYSEAIAVDPDNVKLYSNRSAAYLSDNQKSKALVDARKCVELDPKFVKGYSRLATSLLSLSRFAEARKAYKEMEALGDSSGVDLAKKGLEECRLLEQKHCERQKKEFEAAAVAAGLANDACKTKNKENDEDDLLDDFFNDVEDATTTVKKQLKVEAKKSNDSATISKPKAIVFHIDDLSKTSNQIDRLVKAPNAKWKNLIPFYVLQISHHSTLEDIQKRYRSLSLLVHPDKHLHRSTDAQEAFDIVKKAMNVLSDEDKRLNTAKLIEQGLKQAKKLYIEEQQSPNDNESLLKSLQEKEVFKVFATIESKRVDVERRKRNQDLREKQAEENENKKVKLEEEFDKNWRQGERLENRIGNWRDFQKR